MAEVLYVEPVIRFCAVISHNEQVRNEAIERIANRWGPISLQSEPLPFIAGGYYTQAMGGDLKKVLVAYGDPIDADTMADWKRWTNDLEIEFAKRFTFEERPLNLDPGYITQAKLVLATTKDRDHRVYLRDGIFGEITLTYTAKRWVHHRWTYPDYRTDDVAAFATDCRNRLRDHLRDSTGFRQRQ
ncbi:DUF4416 family protein [Rhodopirellula sp. MGV]|uniref:DUF4416 family protein n=1 Tax=Rhodopirellula sp. MGV TaxID=2023130 RepID=UPI000B96FE8E|nr:DUF4416 family protein [Rhodopirellula sp. MGV]OYP34744.1 GTP-binding protein [Rhodopirellula sp. MGV]PNY34301.1 DUF4416 domain-containing protein [Rhodopirellula baltica]